MSLENVYIFYQYANVIKKTLEKTLEIAETGKNIESILKSPSTEWQNSFQTLYAEAAPSVFVFRNGRNGKDRQLRKLVGIENNLRETFEYGVIYSGVPMISRKLDQKAGRSKKWSSLVRFTARHSTVKQELLRLSQTSISPRKCSFSFTARYDIWPA